MKKEVFNGKKEKYHDDEYELFISSILKSSKSWNRNTKISDNKRKMKQNGQ